MHLTLLSENQHVPTKVRTLPAPGFICVLQ